MLEANTKPKLRTYLEIYEKEETRALVKCNLPRNHRSVLAKLKKGILPLQVELGRWKDVPLEYRTCRVCEEDILEDEYHHVSFCEALKTPGTAFFSDLKNINYANKVELMKTVFKPENLKTSGRYIEKMFAIRQEILYKSGIEEWSELEE